MQISFAYGFVLIFIFCFGFGILFYFKLYFVWCVHNDRCNGRYDTTQKFEFLVICSYLVASIIMHFKSSEPNSKTLFFGQIKIQKNLSRGPNIKLFFAFWQKFTPKKHSSPLDQHHEIENKKNIKIIILIIYDIFHIRWMVFTDGLFDEVEL